MNRLEAVENISDETSPHIEDVLELGGYLRAEHLMIVARALRYLMEQQGLESVSVPADYMLQILEPEKLDKFWELESSSFGGEERYQLTLRDRYLTPDEEPSAGQ